MRVVNHHEDYRKMKEIFLRYISIEKQFSKHTLIAYTHDLEQFLEFIKKEFDNEAIEKVNFKIIRAWKVMLVESKLDNRSVNRKLATLRSFFKFLHQRQYIPSNPMKLVPALKTKKKLPSFVEEKAMNLLFEEVVFEPNFEGLRDKLILELLYGSGIRLSEMIGLKDADISFYNHTIVVLGKRKKERIIPITPHLIKLIKEYQNLKSEYLTSRTPNHSLIVTDKGEEAYPVFIQRTVKKYLSAVTSLQQKSPHILRHTYATHLLNNGADLNAIKDLLGHKSLAATQVYTHNSIEKLKRVFEQAHPKA